MAPLQQAGVVLYIITLQECRKNQVTIQVRNTQVEIRFVVKNREWLNDAHLGMHVIKITQ